MEKVATFLNAVRLKYGKEVSRKTFELIKEWDGSNDTTQVFYSFDFLQMKLKEALEEF